MLLIICTIFITVWCICLIKCEIYTHLYGNLFSEGYKQTNLIDGHPKEKVLKYTKNTAKIYYVDKECGNIVLFKKKTINGL